MIEKILDKYFTNKLFKKIDKDIYLWDYNVKLFVKFDGYDVLLYVNYTGISEFKENRYVGKWSIKDSFEKLNNYEEYKKQIKERIYLALNAGADYIPKK